MLGAKVFTATKARDRDTLGEVLTRWLRDNPRAKIVDKVVTQRFVIGAMPRPDFPPTSTSRRRYRSLASGPTAR